MSNQYQREPDFGDGLRLHLNENTAGCSPRVVEALRTLGPLALATYPDYRAVTAACAAHLNVDESQLLLTNGLDEGLLAAAIALLQRERGNEVPEAIIVEPAFGMYADCVEATGGRIVTVLPREGFAFPLEETLTAITPATRLIFLTSPGNPTGVVIPNADVHAVAQAAPGALVFLDEAYADFTDTHFIAEIPAAPNVVVGRTFAKAYGLAALRIGAVVGHPDAIARLRRSLPPYSINVAAATALIAALEDRAYVAWYRDQVRRSRTLIYEMCGRLGLEYWPSEANFVLVRIGPQAGAVVEALRARRIFVRDRSSQPGCDGCIRITAGVVAHTEECLAALEEVLCAVR
ncbi:MAG TPA: histidinol-phosphate transaminase [Vicinamibacterales bacterium]